MKKLLVILMVVAMASFLFVGCIGDGVTPPVDVDDEDEEDVTPPAVATATPVITAIAGIDITSSAVRYINNAEAALVVVTGTAEAYSEVKVYINGTVADTGLARANATFDVVMAKADLGTDGLKLLHVTATLTGFDESADSTKYLFILDTDDPDISAVRATAETGWVNSTSLPVIDPAFGGLAQAVAVVTFSAVATTFIELGEWTVEALVDTPAVVGVDDYQITSPSGTVTTCERVVASGVDDLVIPGLNVALAAVGAVATTGNTSTVIVSSVGAVTPIQARATLKFDESVTLAAALAGVYSDTFSGLGGTALALLVYQASNNTYYWRAPEIAAPAAIIPGLLISFTASDVADAAGNVSSTTTATCIVEVASLTDLEPTD